MKLRVATRQSPLALWQAKHVQSRLEAAHPGLEVVLVPLTTSGDRLLSGPLVEAGGKGLFIKELEEALLAGRADLAVHSMKDVTVELPAGLCLTAFLPAEDPRDALVSVKHRSLETLPAGAVVGTSSLRRRAQLLAIRPDLRIEDLRGNVGTRLKRLDEGRFDAIVLACAGLKRLGEEARIGEAFEPGRFLPAIGQGVIGVECREDDAGTRAKLAVLDDMTTRVRISAERALNAGLGGSCRAPIAAYASVSDTRVELSGWVGAPDGSRHLADHASGPSANAAGLGGELAERMLAAGAREILASLQ